MPVGFTIFRVCIIALAFSLFFVLTRKMSRQPLKGMPLIAAGVFLIALDLILGSVFHGNLLPEDLMERLIPILGVTVGYFGNIVGVILFLVGTYCLARSIVKQLDPQYSNLVENSLVGVYLVQDGVFKFVNPKFAEIGGYDRTELIGKPLLDLIAPWEREKVRENMEERLQNESDSVKYEVTALKKNGETVELEVYGSRINYLGKPAIHGALVDITARKRFEKQLYTSEERFATLAKSSSDIICETNVAGQFLYVSDNIEEILGFPREELLNKNLFFLVHPDDYMTVFSEFDKSVQRRTSGRFTFRSKHHSGDWKWMESTCQPYLADSGELRLVIVSRDITLRRSMEDEILKASKLESIGVLAGGIAHDFNNILTVILGNVSLIKSLVPAKDDLHSILADTETACLKAKDLTQQFLTFSKGGEPIKRITSVTKLLKETIDFSSHGSKVKCNLHIREPLWPVDIDEGQIGQVFQNLMINAEQAMPNGGIINVYATNEILALQNGLPLKEGNYVQISFQDHGVGIAEEDLKKVFDPYFTTKDRGTGLGLTTAYSIVKNHGGLLTVASRSGEGTTFKIYLPAATLHPVPEARTAGDSETAAAGFTHQTGRILVMDDEADIRHSLQRMLTHIGYEVELTQNGEAALAAYKKAKEEGQPFDAVLMDLTVPGGLGGKETIQKLRKYDPTVKAIVSSGYSTDPIMSDYQNYGFAGVISKPYQIEKLSVVLNDVIHLPDPAAKDKS